MNKALLIFFACLFGSHSLWAAEQPNILFIITDDMYPYQMNFMPQGRGSNYTPNLDRLASEGTIMRNQHVSSPVCTPSRYSVLTGRYASRSQAPAFLNTTEQIGQSLIQWNSYIEPTKEKTIAHHLTDAGYRTGFVGKDHVIYTPGRQPLSRSSNVEDLEIQKIMEENRVASETAIHRAGFEYVDRIFPNNPDYNGSMTLSVHNQDWITEGALNFLDEKDDRPFFLYFATTIPHIPVDDHRSWDADRRATPNGWLENAPDVQPDSDSIARRAREHDVEGKETIIWLDDAIGALLDKLDATGELDNTIIFFFNDHGQSAKGSLYQGGAYDPSIVWRNEPWPAGNESSALVSNIDFTPTILELAGAPKPDQLDGISFLPILENQADSVRDSLFFEIGYTRAVLKDNYKYLAIRYPDNIENLSLEGRQANLDRMNNNLTERGRPLNNLDPMAPFGHMTPIPGGQDAEQGAINSHPNYNDPDQLYDLNTDPDEQVNVINEENMSAKLDELKALMQSYLDKLPGVFPLENGR